MQNLAFRNAHPRVFVGGIIALVTLAQTFFLALPTYVQMTTVSWGLTESQMGFVTAAEVAGGTIGSLLVSFILAEQSMRRLLSISLLALIVGNGLLITPQGCGMMMLARAISGLGFGIIASATLNYLAVSGKYLSILAVAQGLYTLVLQTWLLPALPSVESAYGLIAGLAVFCLPVIFVFERGEVFVSDFSARRSVNHRGAYLALLSLLMLYAACGIIWTFVESLGASAGLDERSMTTAIGIGPILSLGICLLIPRWIEKGYRFVTTMVMLTACTLSAAGLLLPVTLWTFAINTFVFFTGWTGAIILLYATVAAYDRIGRHVAMSTAFLGSGFIIGSSLGGALIEFSGMRVAFAVAVVFSLLATVLYALLRRVPDHGVLDDKTHGTTEDLLGSAEPFFRP